jgi:hypothetical protein
VSELRSREFDSKYKTGEQTIECESASSKRFTASSHGIAVLLSAEQNCARTIIYSALRPVSSPVAASSSVSHNE